MGPGSKTAKAGGIGFLQSSLQDFIHQMSFNLSLTRRLTQKHSWKSRAWITTCFIWCCSLFLCFQATFQVKVMITLLKMMGYMRNAVMQTAWGFYLCLICAFDWCRSWPNCTGFVWGLGLSKKDREDNPSRWRPLCKLYVVLLVPPFLEGQMICI